MRAWAQVPADLEQHDVVEFVVFVAAPRPQVRQAARVIGVGQEAAAAGRLGVVRVAMLFGQGDLRFAAAAVECQ